MGMLSKESRSRQSENPIQHCFTLVQSVAEGSMTFEIPMHENQYQYPEKSSSNTINENSLENAFSKERHDEAVRLLLIS